MSVRELQTALNGLGYDAGPIDGINGPKTKAAVKKFQSDNGLTVDGIVGPKTTAALQSTSSEEKPSGDKSLKETIEEQFPAMAWAIEHPELGPLLDKAADEEWTPLKLQGRLQGTKWFKDQNENTRKLEILKQTDPAQYKQQVDQAKSTVATLAEDLGVPLSQSALGGIADQLLRNGLDQRQLTQAIFGKTSVTDLVKKAEQGNVGGALSGIKRDIDQLSADYFLNLNDETKGKWMQRIASGSHTIASFTEYAEKMALAQMPFLESFISQGLSPAEGLEPYKGTVSRMLEIPPTQVDWTDPKYQRVLRVQEGKEQRFATTAEMSANVRTVFADEWDKTGNAKQAAQQLTSQMSQMFGRRS